MTAPLDVNGGKAMRLSGILAGWAALLAAALGLALFAPSVSAQGMKGMKPMGGMAAPADAPAVPPVAGYAEGRRILFIHTETSDPKIAKLLTDMMGGSPVLVVPALARAPEEMLAPVYVFANGVKPDGPMGPLGFQPDVFPHPPGTPGYSPLRRIVKVAWKNPAAARVLKSAAEVKGAAAKGEVALEASGAVVNMPLLTWPGGRR